MAYLLESSICMTVSLLCYFVFFSRGKNLYFNRGYLLLTLTLSMAIPFIEIESGYSPSYLDDAHFMVNVHDLTLMENDSSPNGATDKTFSLANLLNPMQMVLFLYGMGLMLMLYRYARNLVVIRNWIARSEKIDKESYTIILIGKAIGPFSFMNFIFVNRHDYHQNKIDEVVWAHEFAHIQQRHSLDVIFVELLLTVFYFNPLVWMYRSALKLNHEYAADECVLRSHPNFEHYAYQLIQTSNSKNKILFECSFNYRSTKKRLMMLTKTKNKSVLFWNKVAAAGMVVLATASLLAFKNVSAPTSLHENDKPIIIIDLGHGGKSVGGTTASGITEVAIINSIGKYIREMDKDSRFIFTRKDEDVSLKERTDLTTSTQAAMMVSIHIASSEDAQSNGVEIFYSEKNPKAEESKQIGEAFARKINFRTAPNVVKAANYMVLKNSQCPTVMLSLGYLSNAGDLNYLTNEENQKYLARQIVDFLNQMN